MDGIYSVTLKAVCIYKIVSESIKLICSIFRVEFLFTLLSPEVHIWVRLEVFHVMIWLSYN